MNIRILILGGTLILAGGVFAIAEVEEIHPPKVVYIVQRLQQHGKNKEALDYLDKLPQEKQKNSYLRFEKAQVVIRLDRYDDARRIIIEGLKQSNELSFGFQVLWAITTTLEGKEVWQSNLSQIPNLNQNQLEKIAQDFQAATKSHDAALLTTLRTSSSLTAFTKTIQTDEWLYSADPTRFTAAKLYEARVAKEIKTLEAQKPNDQSRNAYLQSTKQGSDPFSAAIAEFLLKETNTLHESTNQ